MKTFEVQVEQYSSIIVEADDEDTAIEKVSEMPQSELRGLFNDSIVHVCDFCEEIEEE